MNKFERVRSLLSVRSYTLRDIASATGLATDECQEILEELEEYGLVFETKFPENRIEYNLRQLPAGLRIGVISPVKAIEDIEVLDESPPKAADIIDLVT